jgi:DNA-3-methyladenine glycosylase I
MGDDGLVRGEDGKRRCWWGASTADYVPYHDAEWGFPVSDDHRLFEKLCLEGFQAGLSWLTILRKREAFRRAFAGFDYRVVARFGARQVTKLLADPGIVRHRGKIEATIHNARCACDLADQVGSLAAHLWTFEPARSSRPRRLSRDALMGMSQSPESVALSKDLKKRGWRFVGPTTVYAFMQAMGLVDDHLDGCWVRRDAERARRAFVRPNGIAAAAVPDRRAQKQTPPATPT